MNNKFVRIAGKAVSGILVLFLAFNLYFVISSKINGGEPRVFGKELMVVLSGSMSPVFETGALIAVDPAGFTKTYKTGDVITYKSPEGAAKIITHRVVEVTDNNGQISYVTKGDANNSKDPKPIPAMNVIGQYADFHIPLLGYVLTFIKSKLGIALFLIIPGLLLVGGQLVSLFRTIAKMEEKNTTSA